MGDEKVVNTPVYTIMMWTMLSLMFILDMSIHILLNMHFLKRSFCCWRKTGSGAGKYNISDTPNGSTHHIKSVKKNFLILHQILCLVTLTSSTMVEHNFTDGIALGSAFLLYGSVGGWSRTLFLLAHELPQEGFTAGGFVYIEVAKVLAEMNNGSNAAIKRFTAGGFVYIEVAKVLAEMNNGNSAAIKSTILQLTSLISGMAVTICISLVE
ncbi:unnamed protein product [Camellia sinensis]